MEYHDARVEEGLASAIAVASTADRRGPQRRFYWLTEKGIGALQASLADWQAFTGAVSQVLGLADGDIALS